MRYNIFEGAVLAGCAAVWAREKLVPRAKTRDFIVNHNF